MVKILLKFDGGNWKYSKTLPELDVEVRITQRHCSISMFEVGNAQRYCSNSMEMLEMLKVQDAARLPVLLKV